MASRRYMIAREKQPEYEWSVADSSHPGRSLPSSISRMLPFGSWLTEWGW